MLLNEQPTKNLIYSLNYIAVLDAMGKPGSGFMGGNLKWLGSYDECFAVEATVNNSGVIISPFTGRYCLTSFSVGKQEEVML